jgi:hypothetical protein
VPTAPPSIETQVRGLVHAVCRWEGCARAWAAVRERSQCPRGSGILMDLAGTRSLGACATVKAHHLPGGGARAAAVLAADAAFAHVLAEHSTPRSCPGYRLPAG